MEWLDVPVIISEDAREHVFNMPICNEDPEQTPAFQVSQSTYDWAMEDFERHRPGLEYQIRKWYEEKEEVMQAQAKEGEDDLFRT